MSVSLGRAPQSPRNAGTVDATVQVAECSETSLARRLTKKGYLISHRFPDDNDGFISVMKEKSKAVFRFKSIVRRVVTTESVFGLLSMRGNGGREISVCSLRTFLLAND